MGFGIPSLIYVPHPSCKSFLHWGPTGLCLPPCLTKAQQWLGSPICQESEKEETLGSLSRWLSERLGTEASFSSLLCLSLWFDERICIFKQSKILSVNKFLNELRLKWVSPNLSACNISLKMLTLQCYLEMTFFSFLPLPNEGRFLYPLLSWFMLVDT